MGMAFDLDHLADLIHQIRWDDQFPKMYEGFPWNYIMEDVVDSLVDYKRLMEQYRELYARMQDK